ncbi:PepSY domain-containing protein [Mycolicibacterium brumae]|nr:PepSY domain-containing protein [Mycolicibacterium brumae]UWW08245.1 PepSY domain-containing protein [Mycolicibacterium brumae]
MRLHFYAGVLVGPFLLVAAVTGGLYAVAPTIEQWMYRDHLQAQTAGPSLPIADQVRAAQRARPDLAAVAVRPGESGLTTQVLFADPILEQSRRAVFVDPASGELQGDLAVYGSVNALPVRAWLSGLHRNLNLGEPGRLYSELAASWLWVVVLGGLYLWIGRYLRGRGRNRLLTVDRSATGRRRTLNWHGATGIWIATGLLFLSATGLTWSAYAGANVDKLRAALSWSTPAVSVSLTGSEGAEHDPDPHAGHGHGATAPSVPVVPTAPRVGELNRVLDTARAAGLGGPVEIAIPADTTTAFTVAQTRQPWVMSTNTVAVDGATGAVTDASWFADWPLAAKLAAWGIQLHMGTLFGLPNQLALLALAGALVAVIVGGYRMWWQRRPDRMRVGRPPRRGALAALAPGAAVAVLAAAALVGWFIPLLGLSLAGFVAADVAVGLLRRTV